MTWRTKLKDILGWKLQDRWAEDNLDLVDLLSMRSGLPRHDLLTTPDGTCRRSTRGAPILRLFRRAPKDVPVHQSGLRYWRPLLPQKLFGIPYEQFVQENIFTPLGMTTATFNRESVLQSGKAAHGYFRRDWDEVNFKNEVKKNGTANLQSSTCGELGEMGWLASGQVRGFAGAGGVIMSLNDAVRFEHLDTPSTNAHTELMRYRSSG